MIKPVLEDGKAKLVTDGHTGCEHYRVLPPDGVTPSTLDGCEDCLKMGDHWVHLRICMTCGHVGCCDSSKNRHATRHFVETGHPIVRSFEPNEEWGWCYVDRVEP